MHSSSWCHGTKRLFETFLLSPFTRAEVIVPSRLTAECNLWQSAYQAIGHRSTREHQN
jgi:hypothetical protein